MARGLRALTMSTLTPFCSIGVITMKMISNTSITSTMGVTLMSATMPIFFRSNGIRKLLSWLESGGKRVRYPVAVPLPPPAATTAEKAAFRAYFFPRRWERLMK